MATMTDFRVENLNLLETRLFFHSLILSSTP